MDRRDLLKAATATIGGITLATASTSVALAASPASKPQALPGSMVATRDGTRLFYRDWGAGKPIVFLSGWTLPSDCWAYQMYPLAQRGFRCIAYDRRGHGRSSDPGKGYDYDTLADDLEDILDALDLNEVTLVAHSMAGGEAVCYLSRKSARRVKRLLLAGTTLPYLTKSSDNLDGIDAAVFERGRSSVFAKGFPAVLNDNMRPFFVSDTPPAMLDWVMNLMLQASMQALIDCNRALTSTDFREQLPAIRIPTLLVHGDRDVSAPIALTAHKSVKLIPGSQLTIYEGAPHGLFLTHAERFNNDLVEFAG